MSYIIETPVYINTEFIGLCDHCRLCEIVLNTEKNTFKCTDGRVIEHVCHTLTCKHYDMCQQLADNLRYQNGEACAEVKIK